MKNTNNLKHKELYEWYTNQPEPKPKWSTFRARVTRYNLSKEYSIQNKLLMSDLKRKKYGCNITEVWRKCSRCWVFKEWDKFSRTPNWINWYTCNCKDCRNEMKRAYRERTNGQKDLEYREFKRHLKLWDQIYFSDDIWEVTEHIEHKWYIVRSILNWITRQISTSDNFYNWWKTCVRFKKLKTPLEVKTNEQIKQEQDLITQQL